LEEIESSPSTSFAEVHAIELELVHASARYLRTNLRTEKPEEEHQRSMLYSHLYVEVGRKVGYIVAW